MPALGVPVPQMVDQLQDIEQCFRVLSPDPDQVIEVPKILPFDVPLRAALRATQLLEQLVEVPTIISYSSLQQTVEQHVDIPVPGGRGPSSGLQGFSSGQSSTALPSSKKRISERIMEQIVDPVSRACLPGSLSGHGSSSSHFPAGVEERADEPGKGVFRTFPQNKKKCEVGFALGVGTDPRVEPIHSGSSAGGLRRVGAAQGTTRWQDLLLEQTYSKYSLAGSSCCRCRVVRRKE